MAENGWTKQKVYEILKPLKIGRPTINKWLSGESHITLEQLQVLIDAAALQNRHYNLTLSEDREVAEPILPKYIKQLEDENQMLKKLVKLPSEEPSRKQK
jgi:hypothetical protein